MTLATNYWANKRACEILFPILRPGARVVNMSSSCGWLGHITKSGERGGEPTKAEAIHKTLADPELSIDTLDSLMTNFVETAEAGTHKEAGWPSSTYFVSKIGWSALSRWVNDRERYVINASLSIQDPAEDDEQRPQGGHRGEPRPPWLRGHRHDEPQGASHY